MIDMDKLTELVPASEAQQTAMNAEKDLQIKAVAHVINTAANTGLYEAKYNTILLPEVKEELEAKGYVVKFVGLASSERQTLIIWTPTKDGGEAKA